MNLVGRKKELDQIQTFLNSPRPEFIVVYGRRRVGKTYLIKEAFNNTFSFYATGVFGLKTRKQLSIFNRSLIEYGSTDTKIPADWFEAFERLRKILGSPDIKRDPVSGKRVVFLDELPWMDTARSDFKSALDYFWNSWASAQEDIVLIVCGSATSWILDNLIGSRGGFYNRITGQIHLMPFSLAECRELLELSGINLPMRQIIECYMVFGGIPYYLNMLDRRLSLSQNIEELVFKENGRLRFEYDRLFSSLFKHPEKHRAIVEALSLKKSGMLRTELAKISKIGDGAPLTKALRELEQCGFIRKFNNYSKSAQGHFFQLTDPFTLFCIRYVINSDVRSWLNHINTPGYYNWCGNTFEIVCLNHIPQIKRALGISGVESSEYSWRSQNSASGAQIDLLIDRRDSVINLCEMKYTADQFEVSADYEKNILNKLDTFSRETKNKKAVHLTLITAEGLKSTGHAGVFHQVLSGEDLLYC